MITTIETTPALEIAARASQGYMNSLESLWRNERGRGLVWTETGLARCANVFGWIHALQQAGQPGIADVAADFIRNLDHLANYGGTQMVEVSPGRSVEMPRYIVEAADDGGLHSFSLLWHILLPDAATIQDYQAKTGRAPRQFGCWETHYGFSFNGGLIYHGPGRASDPFAMNLTTTRFWGIHT